jgi:DNA-binding response OmpR family regulator
MRRLRKKRILVLDDEQHIRDLLVQGLDAQGYVVKAVAEAAEALRLVGWFRSVTGTRGWDPDLLITDWKMPGYDGTELLYLLRSNPDVAHLPVIMLGSRSPLYDTNRYLQALPWQAQAYVHKPFSFPELLLTVEALLPKGGD